MIADAIEMHLEMMRDSGESVAMPTQHFDFAIDQDASEELCTWVEVDETKVSIS